MINEYVERFNVSLAFVHLSLALLWPLVGVVLIYTLSTATSNPSADTVQAVQVFGDFVAGVGIAHILLAAHIDVAVGIGWRTAKPKVKRRIGGVF